MFLFLGIVFLFPDIVFLGRNRIEALFGVYGLNFGQKQGQSRSNPKTGMFHWSFGSSRTDSNNARDLNIGMLVHHIGVYHI